MESSSFESANPSPTPARRGAAPRRDLEHWRDLATQLREKADVAMQEKPYVLPIVTGVMGVGVGLLLSSKLTRVVACAAAGAMLQDTVGRELGRAVRDFFDDLPLDPERDADEEPTTNM